MAATRKPTKKACKSPSIRQRKLEDGVLQGKSPAKAARDAGYSESFARVDVYRALAHPSVQERLERRRAEAMRRADIHTDEIIGGLAEVSTSSIGDVLPNDSFIADCVERGVDHLIKRYKTNFDKEGRITSREFEMYSRMDAYNQLRDTFGMKEEPRTNTLAERRKREAEAAVARIMERDKVDKVTAVSTLIGELRAIPNTQGLIEVVSELIN